MIDTDYDVVVVGGGAAGLSGALALARARRRVLVIDAGEPRNAPAAHLHNYLSRDGLPPRDLLAAGRAEVTGYGGQILSGTVAAVDRIEGGSGGGDGQGDGQGDGVGPDGRRFRVTLADGRIMITRRLLVTTGLVDVLPDLPGLAERWGRDVLHCPYCHGWEVRDQPVGILATGPMAAHSAQMFRQLTPDVTVLRHVGPTLVPVPVPVPAPAFASGQDSTPASAPTAQEDEELAARGIRVVTGKVVGLRLEDDHLTGVELADGSLVPLRALVVAPYFAARGEVLGSLGLEPVEQRMGEAVIGSYIPADPTGATAVPGVWVAGNVANPIEQLIGAAAAGLRAGAAINADLVAEEIRTAVAVYREQ